MIKVAAPNMALQGDRLGEVEPAAQGHEQERRLGGEPGRGGALEAVAERTLEPGRPFMRQAERRRRRCCAGSSTRRTRSSGNSASRARSLPRRRCRPASGLRCTACSEAAFSSADSQPARPRPEHLQVGRQAERDPQAQLAAGDVRPLRPAPLEAPGRGVEAAVDGGAVAVLLALPGVRRSAAPRPRPRRCRRRGTPWRTSS